MAAVVWRRLHGEGAHAVAILVASRLLCVVCLCYTSVAWQATLPEISPPSGVPSCVVTATVTNLGMGTPHETSRYLTKQ
jgi:hypothetical protein